MQRICFTLQVRPDRLEDYKSRHRSVWPEMQDALRASGWHSYSLFLRSDGLLIGYLLTPDFRAAQHAMHALEVNTRWQAEMAPFFEGLDRAADQSMEPVEEVFHLE